MPYPKNLLNDGEEIVLDLKPHWMYVAPTIIVAVAATIAMIVLWVMTGWGWMGSGDAHRRPPSRRQRVAAVGEVEHHELRRSRPTG